MPEGATRPGSRTTASTAMAMVLEWFRDWASPQARLAMPVLQWYDTERTKLG